MKRKLALLLPALLLVATFAFAAETDQKGVSHEWQGPSDRYTVIDFAAAWCRPCWEVLPRLEAFAKEHPKVRVLVVDVDDSVKGRDALVSKLKLDVPVVWDEKHRIAQLYRPAAMPATFVLDPAGKIVYKHTGSGMKEWNAMVEFLENATK